MDYKDFTAADFLSDGYFREWILAPDEDNSLFWVQWMATHPQQQEEVELARQLLAELRQTPHVLPAGKADSIWAAIEAGTQETPDDSPQLLPARPKPNQGPASAG